MAFLQTIGECKPHVLEIAARAVQQHDRRIVGGLRTLVDVDYMQSPTADLHEPASRRMSLRYSARADDRARGKHRKKQKQNSDTDHGHAKQSSHDETP